MQPKFVSLNISLCLCRFGSGVTSCPYSKFQDLSLLAVAVLTFCFFAGTWGIFLFQGGGVGLQLSQIESQDCAVAHRVFLPLLVSSIKSLCQRHPPNFTERKKNRKTCKKGIFYMLSRLFTIAHFVDYGQELFLNFRT